MAVDYVKVCTEKKLLEKVLQNINFTSCPKLFNFHMHTVYSDGRLKPHQLMEQAIAINLQGLAITDHHSIAGYEAAQNWLEDWKWSHPTESLPKLWSGVEINANLLDVEVHILGYAFDIGHTSIKPYIQRKILSGEDYQAKNVIAAIQSAGGIAILAHPARYRRSHFDLIKEAARLGIDGVETFYAYNNPTPWQPSLQESQQIGELARKYNLLSTCGTDTHGLNLLKRL
ncbi:MAG: PHP domain-containing protein [Cyanobacteria bacterium P01_A01_bin.84]